MVAPVGSNDAGRSTLLNLAVGLAALSAGTVTVLGGRPGGRPRWRESFIAQDMPLDKNLSAADLLHLTRRLDERYAQARLAELGIPPKRKAGRLSGGQQAVARLAP